MNRAASIITTAMLLLAPFSASALDGFPAFPMSFWGSVTLNGGSAPVGTVIRAYYGSVLAGTVTVQETGVYGYTEPTKQKLVIGEGTGAIMFTVQVSSFNGGAETAGDTAPSYTAFSSGTTVRKDLAFTKATSATSGSSGGGGGGGGGGSIIVSTNSAKGDATNDGKVDILDFNTLLIQWGKSGSSLAADFDKNGVVDIFDFNLLLINWSK